MARIGQERIAIIGAGRVGATAAYALMLRALFRDIVLIDRDRALAEAEAADIADANALARPARIRAGDYADAAEADVAIITAGGVTDGTETRLSVASESAAIVTDCVDQLMSAGFQGLLIVSANPVDLMTRVAVRRSGLAARRVIGTGTLLDTSRLKQALSGSLQVSPASIEGLVLGEHGDSEVAAFSAVRIGGQTLNRFCAGGAAPDRPAMARAVREAGYDIIKGKGYTSYGVATAIVRICEAVIRDERAVVPVSIQLEGEYGLSGLCLSLPCVLGAGGIERILAPDLDPEELAGLQTSARILEQAYAAMILASRVASR